MSSGYGMYGGTSRCFPFWQELLACYVVNANGEDPTSKRKCAPALEDYYECLHHHKEAKKVASMQAALNKLEASNPRENGPTSTQIRSLGLLGKEEESKQTLEIIRGNKSS